MEVPASVIDIERDEVPASSAVAEAAAESSRAAISGAILAKGAIEDSMAVSACEVAATAEEIANSTDPIAAERLRREIGSTTPS